MAFTPRFVDAFAAIAVLLLLVATPAYLAQDPAARDLSEGLDFHLPAPRDGDRAEYELVLQWQGEEPVVIAGVGSTTIRLVEPGEVPVDALYLVEEVRESLRAEFKWGSLEVDGRTSRIYYDDAGTPVWDFDTGAQHETADSKYGVGRDRIVSTQTSHPVTDGRSDLNEWTGPVVAYAPSDLDLMGREIVMSVPDILSDRRSQPPDPGRRLQMSAQVFEHRQGLYFVTDHEPFSTFNNPEWAGFAFKGVMSFARGVTMHDYGRQDLAGYAGGEFVTPDFPLSFGGWQWFTEKGGGRVLDVWQFPSSIERGDGQTLPIREAPEIRSHAAYVLPASSQPDLPRIPLSDLGALAHEWLNGLTLPELDALLAAEPASDAARAAANGRLVGFAWVAGQPEETRTDAAEDALPVLPAPPTVPLPAPGAAPPTDPTVTVVDQWILTYASDDAVNVVNATVRTDATGHELVAGDLHCDTKDASWWGLYETDCGPVAPHLTASERLVADPVAAVQRAAATASVDGVFEVFTFQPLAHYALEYAASRYASALSEWQSPTHFVHEAPISAARHPTDDVLPEGIVHWMDVSGDDRERRYGSLWANSGHVARTAYESEQAEGEGQAEEPLRTASAADGSMANRLDVSPRSTVTGGLFLLALWGAVRGLGALKAGAWVPFYAALYAKIAKGDVLDHERRDAIMGLLDADPGLTTTQIGERLGMGWGTTLHHVETLRRNKLVTQVRHGHRRHYFRTGAYGTKARLQVVYGQDPIYGPFLQTVQGNPGIQLKDIVEQVGQGKAGASRTGKRLTELGLLRRERSGRDVRFYPDT